jgi:nucleotide-binding universal stress UspA family protein
VPDSTRFELLSGIVHREIIRAIKKEGADLVVVADRGWSAVERWLLGGTTEKIIRKSPVPVLTVK